ncbi:MAG: HEAT repeat domain-containing protein [Bryobacteraceae bacterium]
MILDPDKLSDVARAEVLAAASKGHLGLDHRFLHSLLDRPEEAFRAVLEFSRHNLADDIVDLSPDLILLFRHWKRPEGLEFILKYIEEDPTDVPDEAIEALVAIGAPALEPLLKLYGELEEEDSGEIAFVLANLGVKDPRILQLLLDRVDFDLSDTVLLLVSYGDPQAREALEAQAANLPEGDAQLRKEIEEAIRVLDEDAARAEGASGVKSEEPDIWALYPEKADLPLELLERGERLSLLDSAASVEVRAAAAASFFNLDLSPEERAQLLKSATHDADASVRARAWEALMNSTEDAKVMDSMLKALRDPELSVEERGGLLVGLAPETDRNEVRDAINKLYTEQDGRAKALEAMWRSLHPSFRNNFAQHLGDPDVEVRRSAVWGVGYYGLKAELDRLRQLFDDEDLRSDAIFAYALALPGETSRGRVKGMFERVSTDARGLSEVEEALVKAALDERLMLAGKEPFFSAEED